MIQRLKTRWRAESGYGEVWKIALPLILSTGTISIQLFVDRMFLTWHSSEAIAASMPAGMMAWVVVCLFMGTAAYTATFVAQYFGAKKYERIGPAVWQGIHITWVTAVVAFIFFLISDWMFALVGHAPEIQAMETTYFKIFVLSTPAIVTANAIAGFFSGLGKTWTVMWVNVSGTVVNVILDYAMIFGHWGFPEMGIAGAALASAIATIVPMVVFCGLILRKKYDAQYYTRRGWRFDKALFSRLLKFGTPSGLQYLLEITAFTVFIFFIGKIGLLELAATNIAFNINSLAFMPMFGLSIAVSVLVGQRLGEDKPALAEKATWSAYHMAFVFFSSIGLLYFLIPDVFIWPFAAQADANEFPPIHAMTINLLKFVALYSLFDAGVMVFSGALKGAGDTRFVAFASVIASWSGMLLPSYFFLEYGAGIYWFWAAITFYIFALCIIFYLRFRNGDWKALRVIETEADASSPDTKTGAMEADEAEVPAGTVLS